MKMLYEFLPIILFFIAFKMYGIYVATGVAIVASIIQTLSFLLIYKKVDKMNIVTMVLIVLLGSLTIILHNPMFIKWKPSVVYWAFALIFLGSHLIGKKVIIERMLSSKITLPPAVWRKLNMSWAIFFIAVGVINIYVVYHFSTNAWVNFKLYGLMGLMIVFSVAQGIYLHKHIENKPVDDK